MDEIEKMETDPVGLNFSFVSFDDGLTEPDLNATVFFNVDRNSPKGLTDLEIDKVVFLESQSILHLKFN